MLVLIKLALQRRDSAAAAGQAAGGQSQLTGIVCVPAHSQAKPLAGMSSVQGLLKG